MHRPARSRARSYCHESVVNSSTIPHSTLSKRWNALSYHKVREAVAGGWIRFLHIPGTQNPSDMHTKPLPWAILKNFVLPLLFWKGDTSKDVPSGSQNPEGSVKGPGPDGTQERDWTMVTSGGDPSRAPAGALTSAFVLSNNQYTVLTDTDTKSAPPMSSHNLFLI